MALLKWCSLVWFVLCSCLPTSQAKCGGRTVLTDLQGTIQDGPSKYPENTLCEWLIRGPYPNITITLKFKEFITECSYDYVFIHDGDSYLSPLIGAISGNNSVQTVVAHSGQMLINLYSDLNYSLEGFVANYTIENCTQGCSGHGTCKDGLCQCDNLWRGKACELEACPSFCLEGEGQGQCNFSHSHCMCNPGFIGESCSLSTLTDSKSNNWFTISSTSSVFSPRMAHSVVYVEKTDTLLTFGGYSLNKVLDDLLQFDFTTSLWTEVHAGSPKPVGRFSHTANLHLDAMVVFGGELQGGNLTNELWLYDLTLNKWTELAVNDSVKPPPLAEHSATVVDNILYIFGGRTSTDPFSSDMYSYSLSSQTGWTKILFHSGNELHLRMLGHTAVYYADLHSLVVFGGFVPYRARSSNQSSRLLAFHLDHQVWTELDVAGDIPRGRSFHSAVLVGDYLVIYGGNVHQHNEEEICHDNKLLFYHLKCHKWISPSTFDALSPSSINPQQGRFSHGAVLRNGSVMLVVGGFSGLPLGDVLGFKLPIAIAAKSSSGGHCEDYSTGKSCKEDPECGWCNMLSRCLSLDQSGSCSATLLTGSCLGPCAVHAQCSACLLVCGEKCGWCVEDSRCYPRDSPTGACQIVTNSNVETIRGWWGDTGHFLTSPKECQTMDSPPGITVIENVEYPNSSFPDGVRIVSTSEVTILRIGVLSVDKVRVTQLKGFVYPFKYQSVPWKSYELYLKLSNSRYSEATLWLSTDDTEANSELVAHCHNLQSCSGKAVRSNNQPLFPSPSEGKRYYIRAEVDKQTRSLDFKDSDLSIEWNRTATPYLSEPLTAQFLQPFASSDCSVYTTCLACMTDASCGWCMTSCMSRNTPIGSCQDSEGNARNLTLNATACTLCSDHVDCHSCVQGGDCVWGIDGSILGCYRKGRLLDRVIQNCSSPCSSRKTCDSCVSDKVGCAWCDKTQSCFVFGTYTSRYPFGQCSHWIDSFSSTEGECLNCSKHTDCKSCLADVRCGWCGNDYDPRIGRCYAGDFNSPYSGQCSVVFPTNGSTVWSYPECPDVDECKLGIAQCHHNATCFNIPDSFNCICNRGFTGDGTIACNKTCYHDCGDHGVCGADFVCDCNLGWLGENCSIDCGCNGHSDCSKGIGICDKCQDNTRGTHCEFCIPGTFGNATTAEGCKPCQCNGHGDPGRDFCDIVTGKCFCTDDTMGDNCDECKPGLKGDPRNGGLCFHECDTRSILTNITQGFISTQLGAGVNNKATASCLWLISSLSNSSHDVVYGPSPPPLESRGQITLTFKELRINCLTDHVDVYDGLPPFILGDSSPVQSFYKLGSFCGWVGAELKSVTATLGNMVVLITANLSSGALSKSFSAKFNVTKCPGLCDGNHRCVMSSHGEECVCLEGWTGENCDQPVCPNNCSLSLGHGHCNLTLGGCVCSDGFTGPDCSQVITPGTVLWEVLSRGPSGNISTDYLARMGHTMVHGPGVLLVYAGYSLAHGLLNDLQSFNLTFNIWSPVEVNQLESSIPSARYLHSAVFYIDSMLVYGGMTENGTDDSLWSFNITSLRWSKLSSKGPKVAGHTATVVGNEIYIIGGYDRILGFNERSIIYNIDTKEWRNLTASGPSPKGVYGHTAVYYPTKGVILVFGGYRFRVYTVSASDELYSLDLATGKWSILQALPSNEPQPKYFHSAAILDDFMVVFGGRSGTNDQFFSDQLLVYNVKCNHWQLLSDNRVLGSKPGGLLSAAVVEISSKMYLFGGFDGQTQATSFRLSLPTDLCRSINSKDDCTAVRRCSWCDVFNVTQGGNDTLVTNKSACFSVTSPVSCHAEPNVTQVVFYNGTDCSEPTDRACSTFSSCSACLASFPYASLNPSCGWCFGCSAGGQCVKSSENCDLVHPCGATQQSKFLNSSQCITNDCEATTCLACLGLESKCLWTPQLKWKTEVQFFSNIPNNYNWNCWRNQVNQDSLNLTVMMKTSDTCPRPCAAHGTCSACLSSHGADAGWKECVWSETLGQCFSPSYIPLVCLGGRCGRIIDGLSSNCLASCVDNDRCSRCMSNYNCGWCGKQGITGEGQCFEGGVHGPLLESCEGRNATYHVSRVWASTLCPLENECLNGRHNCDMTTQVCVDLPEAFECVCKPGYNYTGQPGTCVPVCSKGCLQGRCVSPEVCECYFGWTSANCSVKCRCNDHGQCANDTLLDVCHDCRNHTVGQSCEFCEALYVGDARNNGSCVSCYDVCSHKANVCMNSTQLEYGRNQNFSFELSEVKRWLQHGPYKIEHEGECLCKNNSKGSKCGLCVSGFFNLADSCTRCLCNGHADSCTDNGKCTCLNNTMEDCPSASDCYKNQCIKCKENFMGNPVDNQQCYRKISVMQEFVIGSQTADTEDKQVDPLPHGRAIFYAIYPRFTNVDIRMTIDMFAGAVDVYVANENDQFAVIYNETTAQHQVSVKSSASASRRKRRATEDDSSNGENMVDEVTASKVKLNTFVSYNEYHRALIVRDVRKRLVLTFPYGEHQLRDTRFYLVFIGQDSSGSRGLVYFRQDLSQIDLFVFFSVFFSAFFLVVSVSVFGWKIKQYHTRRRVIEVREHQLETMRSRPFATYSFLCQMKKTQPSCWHVKRDAAAVLLRDSSLAKDHRLRLRDVRERPVIAPVSQEPTADGRACVTTVVFQLPGNECSDFQLLLGSALTVVNHQHPLGGGGGGGGDHHSHNGRKFVPRRTVTFTS